MSHASIGVSRCVPARMEAPVTTMPPVGDARVLPVGREIFTVTSSWSRVARWEDKRVVRCVRMEANVWILLPMHIAVCVHLAMREVIVKRKPTNVHRIHAAMEPRVTIEPIPISVNVLRDSRESTAKWTSTNVMGIHVAMEPPATIWSTNSSARAQWVLQASSAKST